MQSALCVDRSELKIDGIEIFAIEIGRCEGDEGS